MNIFSKLADSICRNKADLKMWVGTSGVIGGTALLCRGVANSVDIVREYKAAKEELVRNEADKKEIRNLTMKTVGQVALKCAPGAVMEIGGITTMWSGYGNMKTAFVGMSAVAGGLQEFIDKLHSGISEKYGEDAYEEIAHGYRTEEVVTKDEDGNETVETVKIYPAKSNGMPSPYARYFTPEESDGAEPSLDYCEQFLSNQENLMNSYYRAHKGMLLYDALEMLGYKKKSKASCQVGWVYDPNDPNVDNRIKLRKQLVYREVYDQDGNYAGYEKVWMIDPNVDGPVLDKMVRMGLMEE